MPYPLDNDDRLAYQHHQYLAELLDPVSQARLAPFVKPGAQCLEVGAGGGSIGLLLGGMLTSALNWHWIFLVNLPIGVAVYALCMSLLPNIRTLVTDRRLDVTGAITVTTSLMLARISSTGQSRYPSSLMLPRNSSASISWRGLRSRSVIWSRRWSPRSRVSTVTGS